MPRRGAFLCRPWAPPRQDLGVPSKAFVGAGCEALSTSRRARSAKFKPRTTEAITKTAPHVQRSPQPAHQQGDLIGWHNTPAQRCLAQCGARGHLGFRRAGARSRFTPGVETRNNRVFVKSVRFQLCFRAPVGQGGGLQARSLTGAKTLHNIFGNRIPPGSRTRGPP